MPVPIPPLSEQYVIVAKINELMAVCDKLEESRATAQTESRRLLEAVLDDALTSLRTSDEASERRSLARK